MNRRFILFGMGRTGSTLLASLLNSHPQICCEGELFGREQWPSFQQPIRRLWQHYPWPLLVYRQGYTRLLRHKPVYGFKLHTKLHGPQIADTAGFLPRAACHGWKIIYLERQVLYNQVISALMTRQTGRYFGSHLEPEQFIPIELSTGAFRDALQQSLSIRRHQRTLLAQIPHLKVTYEADLAHERSWSATVGRICAYLDLPSPVSVKTKVSKPWRQPYPELIRNYADLLTIAHEMASADEVL